jgi:3-dehydroquinate synthetase
MHGEAIAHGMVIEAYVSYKIGYLDFASVEKIIEVFSKLELLYALSDKYTSEKIVAQLYLNDNEPVFALLQELGNPKTISTTLPKEIVRKAVNWHLNKN